MCVWVGGWEGLNLRLTPSAEVVSHPSPTLALSHVTKAVLLSIALFPLCLHYQGYLAHPQPHSSNGVNVIRRIHLDGTCFVSQMTHTYTRTHTQSVYNTSNIKRN